MKKVTCPECGKVVEEALRRGHGRLRVTKIERHTCLHGRLCIGASVHRRDPTGEDRLMYCEACATDKEEAIGMSNEVTEQAGLPLAYTSVVHELEKRILAMIPEHPELVDMVDPWQLFRVEGFNCEDLEPSLAQASAALLGARLLWGDNMRGARRRPGKRV